MKTSEWKEIASTIALFTAALAMVIMAWYWFKQDRRAKKIHDLEMKQMRKWSFDRDNAPDTN